MKHILRFCLLITAVGAFTAVASADPVILSSNSGTVNYSGYNTNNGLNDSGYPSSFAALTGAGFTSAPSGTVNISDGGIWTAALAGTSWVSFENSAPSGPGIVSPANGTYVFTATLPTGILDATITVMSDDTTAVYLNGNLISGTPAGDLNAGAKCTIGTPNCTTPATYYLPEADFNASGSNTLTFGVEQLYNSAMGLDFQVNAAPEPSSLLLLGTGLLGAAEAFRRRLRK